MWDIRQLQTYRTANRSLIILLQRLLIGGLTHGILSECPQNIYLFLWHVSPSGSTIWEATIAGGDREELSPLKSLLT